MTWAEEILELADGEQILQVRFGNDCRVPRDVDNQTPADDEWSGRTVNWMEAQRALAAGEEDDSYWTWPIVAWTDSWVIFTHDYDTMRDFQRLPRHPEILGWDGECVSGR